jgi:membrane protein
MQKRNKFFFWAFVMAARNFVRDECTTVAASISFVFLMAIIPFSALFLFLMNVFQNLFFPGLFPSDMVAVLVADINRLIPFVTQQWVQTHLVDAVGLGSFTTINLLMLPIISGLLFKSMDESFRKIFKLPKRSLIKGHTIYAAMSILAILFFFMFNFIWTLLFDATRQLRQYLLQALNINEMYAVALKYFSMPQINLVSWLILVLFFLTTAKLFLPAQIKLRHRLIAAALFGLLWIGAREIFGLYILYVARINVLFGSLGSVCIVLLWVFYSSAALLYSVEVMYVLHCGPYKLWAHPDRYLLRRESDHARKE